MSLPLAMMMRSLTPLTEMRMPSLRMRVLRLSSAITSPPTLDYDFITEIWWEDIDAVRAFYKSDAYKNIIEPDEQTLFSTGSATYFDEFVQKV